MPDVTIRLFAGLRELAGSGQRDLSLPAGAVVGDVWVLLELGDEPPGIAYALNRSYTERTAALADGDEVALIPPVSGGAPRIGVRIDQAPIDINAAHERAHDARAGAVAAFVGTVRNATKGRAVVHLEYEAFEEMAIEQLELIAITAAAEHDLLAVEIVHRTGLVHVGEASVVIVCSSPHRVASLRACAEIIERLKLTVPIWKREVYADGAVWIGRGS